MCGIAGWFARGKARPNADIVRGLLLANMERGTSATGVSWREGDKIRVRKSAGPADEFIKDQKPGFFETVAESPIALLHARATTKGSEKENENNHPVVGFNWVVTHNGSIYNDDDVWEYYTEKQKVERFAEVDTSAIPLVLSRGKTVEESINNLSLLSGSVTFAAWNAKSIDSVLLGRFGHYDLLLFMDEPNDILYWSSAGSAGYIMPGLMLGKTKFLTTTRIGDNHVLLVGPGGWDKTRTFKVTSSPFYRPAKVVTPSTSKVSTPTPNGGATTLAISGNNTLRRVEQTVTGSGQRKIAVSLGERETAFRGMRVIWTPIDEGLERPWPMHETFSGEWWSLVRFIRKLTLCDSNVKEIELGTAYGRWTVGRPDEVGQSYKVRFAPYKRTKDWWERAYRQRFNLPFETEVVAGKLVTMVDDHYAWENYHMEVLKADGSTANLPGFMCPWCGVWMPASGVQRDNFRCEFCNAANRLAPSSEG